MEPTELTEPTEVTAPHTGDLLARIEDLGRDLRRPLRTIMETVSGPSSRPSRVASSLGLDKSLASRFVRAAHADSDVELMHLVPSPAGLRILAELAASAVAAPVIEELAQLTDRFQDLLDSVPGGRAAIDAQISEKSFLVRGKREQIERQASFKSMSFLLGHFCEVLTTSLFLVPSANKRAVDGIEIHRRIGLRRMRPSTPLGLLSFAVSPEDERTGESIHFRTIDGDLAAENPTAFLLPDFGSRPLPKLEILREETITTLVLAGDPRVAAPARLASAFRIVNAWPRQPDTPVHSLRGYVLHVPCRRLVRDVFIAEGLFPGATPRLTFLLPGPRPHTPPPGDDRTQHFTEVELTTSIEQLPTSPQAYAIPGIGDHPAATRQVLERAGHADTRFRGWRCAMTYPVPLIEMIWWLSHSHLERG